MFLLCCLGEASATSWFFGALRLATRAEKQKHHLHLSVLARQQLLLKLHLFPLFAFFFPPVASVAAARLLGTVGVACIDGCLAEKGLVVAVTSATPSSSSSAATMAVFAVFFAVVSAPVFAAVFTAVSAAV